MFIGLIITLVGCILFFLLLANVIYGKESYVYTKYYYYIVLVSMGIIIIGMAWIILDFMVFLIHLFI